MNLISRPWTCFLWLIILGLLVTPNVIAQDDDEDTPKVRKGVSEDDDEGQEENVSIRMEGKGATEKGAIGDAYRKAMLKYLKDNMDSSDYEASQNEIGDYVKENWRNYCVGDPEKPKKSEIKRKYDGRKITIIACFDDQQLSSDVERLVTKARQKFEGFYLALVSDKLANNAQDTRLRSEDEAVDRNSMFSTIQNIFGKNFKVRDLRALDELMKTEARALDLSASADPAAFIMKKFQEINVIVYLTVRTLRQIDQARGCYEWHAVITCRVVHCQTAEEYINLEMDSIRAAKVGIEYGRRNNGPVAVLNITEREARHQAIVRVSEVVADIVTAKVRKIKIIAQENVYTVQFVKFRNEDRDRVQSAILDLSNGKKRYCDILPGTTSDPNVYEVKMKWLKTGQSQEQITAIIKEHCADNEVNVKSDKSSKGVIYFEPGEQKSGDDF